MAYPGPTRVNKGTPLTKAAIEAHNAELRKRLDDIERRLVTATRTYGKENDSCPEGMAQFVQEVLNIPRYQAKELLAETVKVKVSFTAEVTGSDDFSALTEAHFGDWLSSEYEADDVEVFDFTFEIVKEEG